MYRSTAPTIDPTVRSQELAAHIALLDLAPDAIFARGVDRRITFWNRGAQTTYGFSPEEALGVAPSGLLHTEYPIALEEIDRLVAEAGDHALQQAPHVIVGLADQYSCHVSMIDRACEIPGCRAV